MANEAVLTKIYKKRLRARLAELRDHLNTALADDFQPKPGEIVYDFSGISFGCMEVLRAMGEYQAVNCHKV